jgi:hypothetical protein
MVTVKSQRSRPRLPPVAVAGDTPYIDASLAANSNPINLFTARSALTHALRVYFSTLLCTPLDGNSP